MTVSIHQPNFLPWLGYFDKLVRSDVFVFFDDVQFPRGKTYANRVLIKTVNGEAWITVPVTERGELQLIRDVAIAANPVWKRKMVKTLEVNYAKAPYTKEYLPPIKSIIENAGENLCKLNCDLIKCCVEILGAETKLVYSSELAEGEDFNGEEKINSILKKLGATVYISGEGSGSKRYINEDYFNSNNIKLVWQKFDHPRYTQLHGAFVPNLSIVDLLFNHGPMSKEILLTSTTKTTVK